MQQIALSNIENFTHLFQSGSNEFNSISSVEPIFIAMTRAYQNDENIEVKIDNSYFREMILNEYKSNKSYSPIENIYMRTSIESISDHITVIMLKNFRTLSDEDLKDLRDYLKYLFSELMNNVADHSHSNVGGYVMAQYYKTNKKVQFAVADRGVGFLENMILNFSNVFSEEQAIIEALNKGVTSTKATVYGASQNAGFGLYAMFEILKMTGGSFVIISNDTLVRYKDEVFETKVLEHPWKGVVVAFEFFEGNINHDMDYFQRNYLWGEIIDEVDQDFFL